jgi:hypothetical protein
MAFESRIARTPWCPANHWIRPQMLRDKLEYLLTLWRSNICAPLGTLSIELMFEIFGILVHIESHQLLLQNSATLYSSC